MGTGVPPDVERLTAVQASAEDYCRFCFTGPDEELGDLISPCSCKGDQKWVHLECLRRWQRSVLVIQPTHPAFYERDERQYTCSVCKTKFAIEPPGREALMAGFTGPELAALLQVGCLIVAESRTSQIMAHTLRHNFHIRDIRTLIHWIRGVYLIVYVVNEDASDGTDCIIGVNLTRPIGEDELPAPIKQMTDDIMRAVPDNSIQLRHYLGGPCYPSHATCLARLYSAKFQHPVREMGVEVVGMQGGLWVVGDVEDIVAAVSLDRALAAREGAGIPAPSPEPPDQALANSHAEVSREPGVKKARTDGEDPTPQPQHPTAVHVYWGDARWGRAQLLGEIARGGWGMCRGEVVDVFPENEGPTDPDSLWEHLTASGRLAFAPKNEMMSDDEEQEEVSADDRIEAQRQLEEQMARHREQLRLQLLVQQQREEERIRRASHDSGDDENT